MLSKIYFFQHWDSYIFIAPYKVDALNLFASILVCFLSFISLSTVIALLITVISLPFLLLLSERQRATTIALAKVTKAQCAKLIQKMKQRGQEWQLLLMQLVEWAITRWGEIEKSKILLSQYWKTLDRAPTNFRILEVTIIFSLTVSVQT